MKGGYKNKTGKITSIEEDSIHIDGDLFLVGGSSSHEHIRRANLRVGDQVVFNFNNNTGEIIYIQNASWYSGTTRRGSDTCNVIHPFGGEGEMANMFLSSHDPYDEWADGDTM